MPTDRCSIPYVLMAALGLLFASPATAFGQDSLSREQLQAKVERLERENQQLRQRVAELEQLVASLREQKQQAERTRERIEAEYTAAESERIERQVERTYDARADRTTVSTGAAELAIETGTRATHKIAYRYAHAGRTLNEPIETVTLRLGAFGAGPIYRADDVLKLQLDGQAVELPVAEYNREARYVGSTKTRRRVDDLMLEFRVPADLLDRMVDADRVTATLGHVELHFPQDAIELTALVRDAIGRGG
jgi:outer membrane murein-binding lipoprotein Lpp